MWWGRTGNRYGGAQRGEVGDQNLRLAALGQVQGVARKGPAAEVAVGSNCGASLRPAKTVYSTLVCAVIWSRRGVHHALGLAPWPLADQEVGRPGVAQLRGPCQCTPHRVQGEVPDPRPEHVRRGLPTAADSRACRGAQSQTDHTGWRKPSQPLRLGNLRFGGCAGEKRPARKSADARPTVAGSSPETVNACGAEGSGRENGPAKPAAVQQESPGGKLAAAVTGHKRP